MSEPYHIQPGFHAIHANHLEDLRRAVVFLCRQHPLPPLESDTFLVQSNGIAQWLKLALAEKPQPDRAAGGLGIAAGMAFLFPARFIWQAYRAILPAGEVPEQSPFDKPRLIWRLYRLLPEVVAQEEACRPLARFLEGPDPEQRIFQLAERIADLFDQYQVFRADWLAAWEQGRDVILSVRAGEQPLDAESRWQPLLWRRLVVDAGDAARTSRARIHTRFLEEGRQCTAPANPQLLPRRIIVFGVSSLPRQTLEALYLLSRFSQVVLCVHNPCQYYWADIVSDRDLLQAERRRGRPHPVLSAIEDPEQLHQHANPLLAAWGKQGRDYIRLLDEFDEPDTYRGQLATPEQSIDIFSEHGDPQRPQLLHQIQNDIYHLTPLHEIRAGQRQLHPDRDQSLVFHEAHSPQREVEILHDQLLAAFSTDPTLRPRDVMVMVPDINTYAPHIQAVFGRYPSGHERHIPFTISDQGLRHHEPVVIALETLLSLPQHRFGASEILSLLEVPGIRNRFAISEDDLPLIRRWVQGANIRWGLHGRQRQSLDLPTGLERNTWQAGLRAMLLGYSLGEAGPWGGVEPYDEIGGLQAGLAGQLTEFLQQLEKLWEALQSPHTPAQWETLLADMLAQFFHEVTGTDLLHLNRFRRQLEQWLDDVYSAGLADQLLPLATVREVLLSGLDESGLNQRFLAGKVNFATLMPMRTIPFRRICLLGMNDGDYPRSRPPVDFDLMAREYRPGDRSRREDDRYLFLEALLAAREQLYISWVGRSIRDDSERPPSVLVAQLRDYLDRLWQVSGQPDLPASQALTTRHPLQPFSRAYFPAANAHPQHPEQPLPVAEVVRSRRLFTFEKEWREAHRDLTSDDSSQPLSWLPPEEPITCADLSRFLKYPVETFYQRRLQVRFETVEEEETDTESFAVSGLERWRLEQELIETAVLRASSEADLETRTRAVLDRMARRGSLGMGMTEHHLRQDLSQRLPDLYRRYRQALEEWPRALPEPVYMEYSFSNGTGSLALADVITGLRTNAEGEHCRLVVAQSSLLAGSGKSRQLRYANLLRDWVIHLAGQLAGPPFATCILAREANRQVYLPALPPEQARRCLDRLLAHWMLATTRPLPLHCEAAFAWIHSYYGSSKYRQDRERARDKAAEVYEQALERDAGYLRRSFASAEALFADGRFETLLVQLYLPLWQTEQGEPLTDTTEAQA